MGVLMLSCAFAAESGNKKIIDRFSESKNFYNGKFQFGRYYYIAQSLRPSG